MDYILITGGTSGIGLELAHCFGAHGHGLVLAASQEARLQAAKKQLTERYQVPVLTYQQDLSKLGAAEHLYERLQADGVTVDILVNNAGFGLVGPTEQIDMERDEALMILNMITPVKLCKLLLPQMYARGHGKILNIASIGAYQPGPYTSTYFASKSFLLSYSKAVRYEARKQGVQVCTLCPGSTRTEFFTREGVKTPPWAVPSKTVAQYAYGKLMKNRGNAIPGLGNKAFCLLPDRLKMYSIARVKK